MDSDGSYRKFNPVDVTPLVIHIDLLARF